MRKAVSYYPNSVLYPEREAESRGELVRLSTCVLKGANRSAYDDCCQAGEGKG